MFAISSMLALNREGEERYARVMRITPFRSVSSVKNKGYMSRPRTLTAIVPISPSPFPTLPLQASTFHTHFALYPPT